MTGLTDTDIRLSDEWQLTQAADGDAPLCSGFVCLYQNIAQRARVGLQRREVIRPETIQVAVSFEDNAFVLHCSFQFDEEETARTLTLMIGAVSVEVRMV